MQKNLPALIQKLDEEYNKRYNKSFYIEACNKNILIEGKSSLLFALENRYDDLFFKLIERDLETDEKPLLLTAITMKNVAVATYLINKMYWFPGGNSNFLNQAFEQVLASPPAWAIFDTLVQKAAEQIDAKSIEIFINSLNQDMGERLPLIMGLITEKLQMIPDKDKAKKTTLELSFEQKKKTMLEGKEVRENEDPQRTLTHALDSLKKGDKKDAETDLNPTIEKATKDDDSDPVVTIHPKQPDGN